MTTSEREGRVPQYTRGDYISRASQTLPPPRADLPPQTLEIDAGPGWGVYRVTSIARRNPGRGAQPLVWTMESRERIAQPAPSGGVIDLVVSHGANAGTVSLWA